MKVATCADAELVANALADVATETDVYSAYDAPYKQDCKKMQKGVDRMKRVWYCIVTAINHCAKPKFYENIYTF